ncbi:MerR family transcriptional regulator [Luteimicrobium xylanilyticum]|uniref:Putative HTH-type transcriptional regulator n=1 Tax=Luteimicrobium xylanilyticum TaxID=1133546 RepID=A0A5P9QFV5_9MICO|nr:MerR family transcriptional regulator [Luteimicrobium xylanilyticum]QFV00117.1 putative HTH-type transcriptional regulator [Luteimicrobium xylanilyticum]
MTATTSAVGGLTIADAAAATGLTVHTLRYYERDGLMLDPVDRAPSGHRRYSEADLGWIVMLTRLRATGMGIAELREYATLCRDGDGNEGARLTLLRAHRDRVLAELEATREHLRAIDAKIGIYEGRLCGPGVSGPGVSGPVATG